MKKGLIVLAMFVSLHVVGWGIIGHRTIGYIAEQHLSSKAKTPSKGLLLNIVRRCAFDGTPPARQKG